MLFKNLVIYRFTKPFTLDTAALEEKLAEHAFTPCRANDLYKTGWVAPLGRQGVQLVHTTGQAMMICLKREEKLMPGAVIKELLDDRVAEIEEQQARKVRKKERDELKEQLVLELMPKAFSRSSKTYGYIDAQNGWLVVNVSSVKKAEEFTSTLRKAIGSLPIRIPAVQQAPRSVMTDWLRAKRNMPSFLSLGLECELQDSGEEKSVVRCRNVDLLGDEVETHLDAGKEVTKLSLAWEEQLSFVIQEDMQIKRLKFGDVIQEQLEQTEADDAAARFDASFAILSLELAKFIPALLEAFGGEDRSALVED